MERGKRICNTLKELRKRIADANGIPYEIEDCHHDGPCPSTCPKCEAEVRFLKTALDEKRERGEDVIIKGLMTEEELTLLVNNQNGIVIATEPPPLMGIPALPREDKLKEELQAEILFAVIDCIQMAKSYPNVGLFISETDYDVLCVRDPAREGEALFDYRIYDWRELLEDGRPSNNAIRELAERLISGDDNQSDVEEEPTKIKQVLTSITVAGTTHVKNIKALADDIYEGVEPTMYREVDNKHDSNAIALFFGDNRVGYVPKEKNEILANLIAGGISLIAVVTKSEWHGSWFEIKVDIALPE